MDLKAVNSQLSCQSPETGHGGSISTSEIGDCFTLTQDSVVSVHQHPPEGTCLAQLCLQTLESTCCGPLWNQGVQVPCVIPETCTSDTGVF